MVTKQLTGNKSTDGSVYVCITDGAGNLTATGNTMTTGVAKRIAGALAPDGSRYATFTDGAGNLK